MASSRWWCLGLLLAAGCTPPSFAPVSGEAGGAEEQAAPGTQVDLNQASADELAAALGLTRDEARGLVEARQRAGWFRTWREAWEALPGLSRERWEVLRKGARLGPPLDAVAEERIRAWRRAD